MGDGTASPIAGGENFGIASNTQSPPGTPKIFLLVIDKQKNFQSFQNSPKFLLTFAECIDNIAML